MPVSIHRTLMLVLVSNIRRETWIAHSISPLEFLLLESREYAALNCKPQTLALVPLGVARICIHSQYMQSN
jgi:hypothetical protein